jgi:hypothetical protein
VHARYRVECRHHGRAIDSNAVACVYRKTSSGLATEQGILPYQSQNSFLETFLVESWLEHLRQHQRVTNADRLLQNAVHQFQVEGVPKVTHFIAAEPGE